MACCFGCQQPSITLLLVGIDNAGKTTTFNTLKGDLRSETTSSFGFASSAVKFPKCRLQLYDVGGGRNIRRIWRIYVAEIHGVMYVIDAADPARFQESHDALHQLLQMPQLAGKPLLVLANKQDMPGAKSCAEVSKALDVAALQEQHACHITACTAHTPAEQQQPDPALNLGLSWLISTIKPVYRQLQAKVQEESAEARAAEAQRSKDRKERARVNKLERLQKEQEAGLLQQQQQQQQAQQQQQQSLGSLPGSVHCNDPAVQQTGIGSELIGTAQAPDAAVGWHAQAVPAAKQREEADGVALLQAQRLDSNKNMQPAEHPTTGDATVVAVLRPLQHLSNVNDRAAKHQAYAATPERGTEQYTATAESGSSRPGSQAQPTKPKVTLGLMNLLQAAVHLPSTAAAAAPEVYDLEQAAHDACGPTPRVNSITNETSSIQPEASQSQRLTVMQPSQPMGKKADGLHISTPAQAWTVSSTPSTESEPTANGPGNLKQAVTPAGEALSPIAAAVSGARRASDADCFNSSSGQPFLPITSNSTTNRSISLPLPFVQLGMQKPAAATEGAAVPQLLGMPAAAWRSVSKSRGCLMNNKVQPM